MSTDQLDPIVRKRAKAYLRKMNYVVGHDPAPAISAARVLIYGFGLGAEAGAELLRSDFATRCVPPLSHQQVQEIISIACKEPPKKPAGWLLKQASAHQAGLSDLGNATYFVKHFGDDVRFCRDWDSWFIWDRKRWHKDRTGEVDRKVIQSIRKHQQAAANGKLSCQMRKRILFHLLRSEAEPRIRAIIALSEKLEPIPIVPEQFDVDPWKLNCLNGTLDLCTGNLQAHRREDRITKLIPFDFDRDAECPQWLKFLDKVLSSNKAIIDFIQRLVGYTLSGVVTEQCMAILYGDGKNGKSTFIETVRFVLNDYAIESAPGLLVEQRNSNHPTEIADLHGARFVSNSEIGQGQKLDEAKFKRLTGGDALKARKMYQDFYQFDPTFTLWMSTNHKPVIRETKEAVWRRIFLIPFLVVIADAEVDKNLLAKLKSEATGILAWMVRGCLAWQRDGLKPPAEVLQATTAYRQEMDVVGEYILERCILEKQASCPASELYADYREWCEREGTTSFSQKRFGSNLKARSDLKAARQSSGRVFYEGIRLRRQGDPPVPLSETRAVPGQQQSVSVLEFAQECCVTSDSIYVEASRLYDAYSQFCRKLGRPEVSMAEINAFFISDGRQQVFGEEDSLFHGLGLLEDYPELIASESSEASARRDPKAEAHHDNNEKNPSDPSIPQNPTPMSDQNFHKLIE